MLRLPTPSEAPTVVLGDAAGDTADAAMPSPDRALLGRYRDLELVGEGGMSRVYKAVDSEAPDPTSPDAVVAIKALARPFVADSDAFVSLQSEVHALRELVHPHIVKTLGCAREGTTVFIMMEYLAGHSLYTLLHAVPLQGTVTGANALTVITAIASALDHAHGQHIVHGDLKPGNVFITDRGEVKVIDFGLANWIARPKTALERREAAQTRVASAVTPRYASPQLMARYKPEPADDVYSLACLAYELLTGTHPFDGISATPQRTFPPPYRPGLSRPQYAAIVRGLQLERRDRTPSIQQFLAEFTAPAADGAGPKGTLVVGGIALALVALAGLGTWYLWHPTGLHRPAVSEQRAPEPAPAAKSAAVTDGTAATPVQDCPTCPSMVMIPAGQFVQGAGADDASAPAYEKPQHVVTLARPFALSRNAVTVGEFAEFAADTRRDLRGCEVYDERWHRLAKASWQAPGFAQTANHPVTCVSWSDATAYAQWLSSKTGHHYRLPSAAEWEYAARAGGGVRPWETAQTDACTSANVADRTAAKRYPGWDAFDCDDGYVYTAPSGSFMPNAFGLNDMLGNVFQWTQDCWQPDYTGAPDDGRARSEGSCGERELRGGSWFSTPARVRASYRNHFNVDQRTSSVGFRLVRDEDR